VSVERTRGRSIALHCSSIPVGDFFAAEYGQAFCNFVMPRLCCFPFHSIPSCHVHIANKNWFPRFILVSFARTLVSDHERELQGAVRL
jgi:hypothetical protein